MEVRKGEDRLVRTLINLFSTANVDCPVPDLNAEDSERPPHDGEYVGTIEVVVLRCHPLDQRSIFGNETSPDESSDGNEPSTPKHFDGASDRQSELKSKSNAKSKAGCQAQFFGLDGGWDAWGPPPPPLDKPKTGRIEMTSEDAGTWNPVGQESKNSNALEKTKRWDKRSESRDHFQLDFQKRGSPAGSQRGRSDQPRSITGQEISPPPNLRGGGPGSYSIASSEAMRNWNGGPPAPKEWTQGDAPSKANGRLQAAFDPWTANLPTGDFTGEGETKPQTHVGAWEVGNETKNKPGSKKGSKKDSIVSKNPDSVPGAWGVSNDHDQGKNDDWEGNKADEWGNAGGANAQNNDQWNVVGGQSHEKQDDWNNNAGASSWDAPNNDEKRDDGAWDPPHDTSNGNNDDVGGNENIDTKQNDKWGATNDNETKQNDGWGATTGNDAQQGNDWGGDTGPQTDTWGGGDTKQAMTGAQDPEKGHKPTSNQQAASGEKVGSTLSFGNSRAKGPKPVSKAGSQHQQGKPASGKPQAASIMSNKKPLTFDWLKPSLEKVATASDPPVAVKNASVPGAWVSPVAIPKQVEPHVPPTFSISTPPKPKPYWSKWRNPNTVIEAEMEEEQAPPPEELEEPLYRIPAEVAQRNMMSHQVRPGRPAAYTHKRNKPKYMDTHESPYAVFLFKYRDKEIIEHMLKTTITEPEVDEKARLAALSKQELIDELMKTKSKLSMVESDSSGPATFVKKLDEKLSKLETGKEDVPAIGDWVNTTSPTNGQGVGNVGEWGNNGTQKGNRGGDSGNVNETSNANGGDWGGNENSNEKINGNAGGSWGGNGDSNANGKSHWNNEVSNGVGESGNGGNDWGTTDQNDGGDKKDDDGWGGKDNRGGGNWSNDNKNNSGDNKPADDWANDNTDTKKTDTWGNEKGGDSWDNTAGGGDGGWGGDDDKNAGTGNRNAGVDNSWGADTGEGGGGGGGGW